MRLVFAAAVVLLSTGCATQYEASFPPTDSGAAAALYLQPALYQEEVGVQVAIVDSSATAGQYGLIGALVGAAIDSAINNSTAKKAERKAEVIREATVGYDLSQNLRTAIAVVPAGTTWAISDIADTTVALDIRDQVAAILDAENVDNVVVLYGSYEMTPTVEQVSATITQQVYLRSTYVPGKKPKAARERSFYYQSPVRGLDYRAFDDGEKEQLKVALTNEYERSIAIQPDDEDSLRKSLANELKELDEAEQIPEALAISETWPRGLLEGYLDQARDHLKYMVEHDWNDTSPPLMDKQSLDTFYAFSATGYRARMKGDEVHKMDENVVYRTYAGDLFSVPPAAE